MKPTSAQEERMRGSIRSQIIPTFLERIVDPAPSDGDSADEEIRLIYGYDNWTFNYERFYQDALVSEAVADYLFSKLHKSELKDCQLLCSGRSQGLAKLIKQEGEPYGFFPKDIVTYSKNGGYSFNGDLSGNVCLVELMIMSKEEVDEIKSHIKNPDVSLDAVLSIFSNITGNTSFDLIPLFDKSNLDDYRLNPVHMHSEYL